MASRLIVQVVNRLKQAGSNITGFQLPLPQRLPRRLLEAISSQWR